MHVICVASVVMSVESVVESIVSMYENRQSKSRNLGEDRGNNEMMIAVNGPNIAHWTFTSGITKMGNAIYHGPI